MRTIGEVAELAGVSTRMLRWYDEIGLLTPLARSDTGYRLYGREDLLRLREILIWRQLGFPLADIQALMDDPDRDQREAVRRQLELASAQLGKFHTITQGLELAAEAIDAGRPLTEDDVFAGFARSLSNEDETGVARADRVRPFERVPLHGVFSKRPRYGKVGRLQDAFTPDRVVATDPIRAGESLLALGVLPVGAGTYEDRFTGARGVWPWPPTIEPLVRRQISDVGYYGGDRDRVRRLAPELIVDVSSPSDPRASLTKWMHGVDSYEDIAPTVLLPYEADLASATREGPTFHVFLRQVGDAVGRSAAAEALLALWDARIAVLRPHLDGHEVSVVATWGPGEGWGAGFYSPTRLHPVQVLFPAGLTVIAPDGAEPFNEFAYTYDDAAARGIGTDTVFLHTRFLPRSRVREIVERALTGLPASQRGRVFELGWEFVNSGWFGANWQLSVIAGAFGIVQLRAELHGVAVVAAVDPTSNTLALTCTGVAVEAVLTGPGLRTESLSLKAAEVTRLELPGQIVRSLCAFPDSYAIELGSEGATAPLTYDRESAIERLTGEVGSGAAHPLSPRGTTRAALA